MLRGERLDESQIFGSQTTDTSSLAALGRVILGSQYLQILPHSTTRGFPQLYNFLEIAQQPGCPPSSSVSILQSVAHATMPAV